MKYTLSLVLSFFVVACAGFTGKVKERYPDQLVVYGPLEKEANDYRPLLQEMNSDYPGCVMLRHEDTNLVRCEDRVAKHLEGLGLSSEALDKADEKIYRIKEMNTLNEFLGVLAEIRSLEKQKQYRAALAKAEAEPRLGKSDYYRNYLARLRDLVELPRRHVARGLQLLESNRAEAAEEAATLLAEGLQLEPQLAEEPQFRNRAAALVQGLPTQGECSLRWQEPQIEVFALTGYAEPVQVMAECNPNNNRLALQFRALEEVRFSGKDRVWQNLPGSNQALQLKITAMGMAREKNQIAITLAPLVEPAKDSLAKLGATYNFRGVVKEDKYQLQQEPRFYSMEYMINARGANPGKPAYVIKGKQIQAAAASDGKFTVGTEVAGRPADLIYGHPNGVYAEGIWSSYISVKVDDRIYRLDSLTYEGQVSTDGSELIQKANLADEKLAIEISLKTMRDEDDLLLISVSAKNLANRPREIGFRFLIDTWGGHSDGVPFTLPGAGEKKHYIHTTEFKFSPALSPLWQSVAEDGNIIYLKNTLVGPGLIPPDEVAFVAWGPAFRSEWEYPINQNNTVTGDSAVLLWWQPQTTLPQQTRRAVTLFGSSRKREGGRIELADEQGNAWYHVSRTNNTSEPQVLTVKAGAGEAVTEFTDGSKEQQIELAPGESIDRIIPLRLFGHGECKVIMEEEFAGETRQRVTVVNLPQKAYLTIPASWESDRDFPVRYTTPLKDQRYQARVRSAVDGRILGQAPLSAVETDRGSLHRGEIPLEKGFRGKVIVEILQ